MLINRCLFGLPLVLFLLPLLFAQERLPNKPSARANLVVEVLATDHQLNSKTKYVYLRAFSNGLVEYQDPLHFDLFRPTLLKRNISTDQLKRLKEVLSDTEVSELRGQYNGGSGVDTSLRWEVTVTTPHGVQRFTLWNFTYGLEHGVWGRPITEPARRVGCELEEISNRAKGWNQHSPQCKQKK